MTDRLPEKTLRGSDLQGYLNNCGESFQVNSPLGGESVKSACISIYFLRVEGSDYLRKGERWGSVSGMVRGLGEVGRKERRVRRARGAKILGGIAVVRREVDAS